MRVEVAGQDQDTGEEREPLASDSEREALLSALREYALKLDAQAQEQVGKRKQIEERWLDDLRQYHGRYDDATEKKLKSETKSRLFLNLTRSKTLAWERRLSDMLFPTDEKNWGIKPTPNPDLAVAIERGKGAPDGSAEATAAATANEIREEAARRATAMEREIEDQLRECNYNAECRRAIKDGCKLGTGITKGPIIQARVRRRWQQQAPAQVAAPDAGQPQQTPPPSWGLTVVEDNRPGFERVNPWAVFPDMAAHKPIEAEFWFERHIWNRKQVQDLAKRPDFIVGEVRALLVEEPEGSVPDYMSTLRTITDGDEIPADKRYIGWEYRGPIDRETMLKLCKCFNDRDMHDMVSEDPLETYEGVIWFCQGKVLKFGIHFLDSGEPIYSFFSFEEDETSMFGFGVPYLMRNPQSGANGAWRMMFDNAGLSVGPQVVINDKVIEPVDGDSTLAPRKIWRRLNDSPTNAPAFEVFNIPSGQAELGNIVGMCKQAADEESQLPLIAQGEPAAHSGRPGGAGGAEKTMGGLALLMNSVNVVFRGVVKSFDDDLTVPNIRRLYDWNMQFSKKDDIKGDYEVDARGSSVLLVREIQAANLMVFALQFGTHPIYGPMTDHRKIYRRTVQANMLPADDVVKSDEQMDEDLKNAGEQVPPEAMKAQFELQALEVEWGHRMKIAAFERETAMMKLAEQHNMSLDQLQVQLGIEQIKDQGMDRRTAAEFAVKERHGSGI